jgi:cytochrome c oxidase accessory protein FixG
MGEPRRIIPITPEHALADQEQALYEVRRKIYPRAVTGRFAAARVALVLFTQAVFYGVPWLQWGGRQAVLFDLGARKFYIFGIVFWPQDFIYLTILLTISALSLFLFTAVAGRLYCGYACPQTVYTEMFLWVERKIEGDRMQRMKLDAARLTPSKVLRKASKHGVWIAIALWTGITFVGYFTPITALLHEIGTLSLSGWQTFWIGFYSFATYGNAGWMREQVCKYMCPYARFQSVMFDPDTLIVTYDGKRGEPRGARSRKVNPADAGLGDCVDCEICVQVCPTGIDIRKGLQYECIGCAACIDACDQVMARMDYPPGLIRYATQNSLAQNYGLQQAARRVLRPRVLVYTAILWTLIVATGVILWTRVPLRVDVIRDRTTLAREVDGEQIENVYRLQLMNSSEVAQRVTVRAAGIDGLMVFPVSEPISIPPSSSRIVPIRLRAPEEAATAGSHRIEFVIQTVETDPHSANKAITVHEKSVFLFPR